MVRGRRLRTLMNNAQSELLKIEYGLHFIGLEDQCRDKLKASGLPDSEINNKLPQVKDYAARIGKGKDTVEDYVLAARVSRDVSANWAATFDGPPEAQIAPHTFYGRLVTHARD